MAKTKKKSKRIVAQRPNSKEYLGLDFFACIYGASSLSVAKAEIDFWKNGDY